MLVFPDSQVAEVEQLRVITQGHLTAEHLPDDNDLLSYLGAAGYLVDKTLTGYLPAALFSFQNEPDAVEILIDNPIGEYGLTMNGGPRFTYEFPHRRLNNISGSMRRTLSTDTGNAVEIQTGDKFFLPKGEAMVRAKVRRGLVTQDAVDAECERLGIAGIASSADYVSDDFQGITDLSFTRAIREAAKWASYTFKNPWDSEKEADYPRTLTVDEAKLCLSASLQNVKREKVEWDITTIRRLVKA